MRQALRLIRMILKRKLIQIRDFRRFTLERSEIQTGNSVRRVAVCYLGTAAIPHHNNGLQQDDIISSFRELGYSVEVFNHGMYPLARHRKFDVVFGFGESWRKLCSRSPDAKHILYGTEATPYMTYINEAKSLARCKRLLGTQPPSTRGYRFYSDDDYILADVIFQMGKANIDVIVAAGSHEARNIHYISSYGIDEEGSKPKTKVGSKFLWFGSAGAAMKGLDLSVAAFRQMRDLELIVAGCPKKEERHFDFGCANIAFVGNVDVFSEKFDELADEVGFCIFPTGAEGISTALITCMYRGIIPITTKQANIYFGEYPIIEPSVEAIVAACRAAVEMDQQQYLDLSERTRKFALTQFSKQSFRSSLSSAILESEKTQ